MFLSTLTPKFYVALTGTSSLISGLILIFEWWYFRKYGTSFIGNFHFAPSTLFIQPFLIHSTDFYFFSSVAIEQVSLNHISPWFSNDTDDDANNGGQSVPECKVWRNPLNLFRGSEYQRFYWATNKEPLTYYDMNLSAQDHQTFFTCDSDNGLAEYELMQTAWRERNPVVRIKAAHDALKISAECAPAYILLAEEEAVTIIDAEKILRHGLKVAEVNYRRSQAVQHQGHSAEAAHRRDTNVLIYIKRRLAMCARKLGRLKEATKMFRDLTKEIPPIMNVRAHVPCNYSTLTSFILRLEM